jgi:hypothetical protein
VHVSSALTATHAHRRGRQSLCLVCTHTDTWDAARGVQALLAAGRLTEAAALATTLVSVCSSAGLHAPHVRVLLLLGQVREQQPGLSVVPWVEKALHLESRPKAAARLDIGVSVGWVSQSSRGLWGGDALLLIIFVVCAKF